MTPLAKKTKSEENETPVISSDSVTEQDSTVVSDTGDENNEDEVIIDANTFDEKTEQVKQDEDLAYVRTLYDHTCNIGGKTYMFKAGVKTPVPKNVQEILSKAGKLRG